MELAERVRRLEKVLPSLDEGFDALLKSCEANSEVIKAMSGYTEILEDRISRLEKGIPSIKAALEAQMKSHETNAETFKSLKAYMSLAESRNSHTIACLEALREMMRLIDWGLDNDSESDKINFVQAIRKLDEGLKGLHEKSAD